MVLGLFYVWENGRNQSIQFFSLKIPNQFCQFSQSTESLIPDLCPGFLSQDVETTAVANDSVLEEQGGQ